MIHFQEAQALENSVAELRQHLDNQSPSKIPDSSAMFALESALDTLRVRFVALQKKYIDSETKHEQTVATVVSMSMAFQPH